MLCIICIPYHQLKITLVVQFSAEESGEDDLQVMITTTVVSKPNLPNYFIHVMAKGKQERRSVPRQAAEELLHICAKCERIKRSSEVVVVGRNVYCKYLLKCLSEVQFV